MAQICADTKLSSLMRFWGFASLAFAHSAQPHCPRPQILEYSDLPLWAGATSYAGDR